MIDYAEKEQQICDILNVLVNSEPTNEMYTAYPCPNNTAEFTKYFKQPRIYVTYCGSDWEKPKSTAPVMQDESMTFEVAIRCLTRHDFEDSGKTYYGVFSIVNDVIKKLLGYHFAGCKDIRLTQSGLIEEKDETNNNNWNYVLRFCIDTMVVSVQPQSEDKAPLAKQIDNTHE